MVCTTAYGKPILPPLYFLRPYVYIEYEMPATYDCACVYSTLYGIWVVKMGVNFINIRSIERQL